MKILINASCCWIMEKKKVKNFKFEKNLSKENKKKNEIGNMCCPKTAITVYEIFNNPQKQSNKRILKKKAKKCYFEFKTHSEDRIV